MGPPEVLVAEVAQQNVPIFEEWVAQLNGPVNAEITPKVQGYLLRQDYQNGYFVKKGQLLFELDPRQYQAALEQAKAEVAVAQAKSVRSRQRTLHATLRWPRRTPSRKSSSITTLPTRRRARRKCKPPKASLENAEVESRLDQGLFPDRWHRRRIQLADRRSGGHHHQDDDGLAGQSHLGLLQRQRKRSFWQFAPQITGIITGKVSKAAGNDARGVTSRPTTKPIPRRARSST